MKDGRTSNIFKLSKMYLHMNLPFKQREYDIQREMKDNATKSSDN